ncbi:MAG: hypothetical protein Q7R49_00785 [Candidatus Daviesbacteria bacterium]|nr:hypothetical protein [Candidatus Daviesbacteria bacterium]
MSGKTISTIYFYIVSAASLVLIIIGIFNAINFTINSTQYDEYPLLYPQGSCEAYPYKFGGPYPVVTDGSAPNQSAADLAQQKQECLKQESMQRKQHMLEDMKNSIAFTIIGLILFSIHFPLARRQSK